MIDVLFITSTTSPNVLKESVGTMILATILREQGIGVEILPFGRFGNLCCFEELVAQGTAMILEKKPRILSFYTRCDCYHTMLEMARRVKEQWDCKVVVGNTIRLFTNGEPNNEVFWKQVTKCVEAKSYFDLSVDNDFVRLDKNGFTKGDADSFKAWVQAEHPEIPWEKELPEFDK